jgi:Plasmid pRiA4b ORF-3-like protein
MVRLPLGKHSLPNPTKTSPPTYLLKITLVEIKPPIWRLIQVPSTMLLCCLHDALQPVFGWTDSHLHSFEKDGKYWGIPDYDDLIDESNVRLSKMLKAEGDSMIYVYDFGDNWRHEIILEKIIPVSGVAKTPVCLGGERRGPPEDVGGVSRYEEFLEIIFDPTHDEYEHYVGWAGGHFLDEFDMKAMNEILARMRWPVRHKR